MIINLKRATSILYVCSTLILAAWLISLNSWREPKAAGAAAVFATIVVNTNVDAVTINGLCSLREALLSANGAPANTDCTQGQAGLDTIQFNIGTGTPTINVTSALPTITEPVVIDGATGGATRIELNGTDAGASTTGLVITAGNSTIKSLVINRFTQNGIQINTGGSNTIQDCYIGLNAAGTAALANNNNGIFCTSANNIFGGTAANVRNVISGNNNDGIEFGTGAGSNQVQGNYIGTNATGTAAIGNSFNGILVFAGNNHFIGGTAAGAGNLLSGNGGAGLSIANSAGNQVLGNLIGTNAAGSAALANNIGVTLATASANNNTIGGLTASARNVISGNTTRGLRFEFSASNNQVQGNFIGTNAAGTAALGNGTGGVFVNDAPSNTLGGTAAGARNLISGNLGSGIELQSVNGTLVQGNFIGTDVNGTAALGNSNNGIVLQNGMNNTIGGTTAAARNLISGNTNRGILIFGAMATGNLVQGNYIGTDASGTAALPNSLRGVEISGSPGNTVGGTAAGTGNVIAFNTQAGVVIAVAGALNNGTLGNSIFANGALGIDLANNGLTANDAGDGDSGVNNLQNFPVLNFVTSTGTINGALDSTNASSAYPVRLEFFANTACDSSGNGEGEVFLGSTILNAPGGFTFTATLVPGKNFITATATDSNGNTSEFSACRAVNTIPVITASAPLSRPQGSSATNSQIATVTDPDQALNTLTVQVNNGASATVNGVTVSNLAVNVAGVVTADIASSCAASNATFTLKVIDNASEMNTATLTVNVTANTAPVLTYNNQSVVRGGPLTINPATGPSDNGSVNNIVVQSQGTYTGTISVHNSTGVVSLSNAIPVGMHMISIQATDNCGLNTSTTFTLTVNKADTTLTSLTDVPDPSVTGQSYTAGFTLNVTAPGAGTPTGTVTVTDGTGGMCTATLPATSCVLSSATMGAKTLTFTYSGDANFNGSSNTAGHQVNRANTTTTIIADNPDPSVSGGNVVVNFTVMAAAPGGGTPTGNVVITVSGGSETCTDTVAVGTCTLALTALGNRTLTATFAGDANYNGSADTEAHTVNCPTIIVNPTNPTLPAGEAAQSYSQTFTQTGGNGAINWSVSAGALPNGLVLTGTTGVLNGTPIVFGLFNFTIRATDAIGCTGERAYTLTINNFCATIAPANQTFMAAGGTGMVTVTGPGACNWTAVSNAPWITVTGGSSGTGNGTVSYTVAANAGGAPRTGTLTIAGRTFDVNQIVPGQVLSEDFENGIPATWTVIDGGNGVGPHSTWIAVNVAAACPLPLPAPFAGMVALANGSPDCVGTGTTQDEQLITPSFNATGLGRVLVQFLNQFKLDLGPTHISDVDVSLNGGTNWINVLHQTAAVPTPILTTLDITSVVAPNPTNVRLRFHFFGSIPSINRPAGGSEVIWPIDAFRLTYSSISPTSQNFTASGGPGNVSITVAAGESWTAQSNVAWLTAVTTGGTGSGTANYTVAPNTAAIPRTGTLTIAGNTFTVNQAAGSGLQFFPLPQPVRLLETRPQFNGCTNPGAPISAGGTLTLPARTVCAGIPANAAAVTGNITVVPAGPGFLTLFPSTATQPVVANSNFVAGEITNNVFTVGLGAGDGAFKIFSSATTDVIIDVTGYYAPPGTGGLYFHPLPAPVRLLETRAGFNGCITPGTPLIGTGNPNADPNLDLLLQGRSPITAPCNAIPASAQVLVGNATSVFPSGGGYLTIYPSGGTRPVVASTNYAGNDVINGPFAVKLGADGKFKVYTLSTTHLVIDILGYYSTEANDANGAGLLFTPLPSPVRLLETRPDFPGFPLTGCTRPNAPITGNLGMATHTQMAANFCGLPATAQAVVGNVSVVNTTGAGFLTLFPANLTTAPLVATSNYPAPATFGYNRHYIVGLSPGDGMFKVLTQFTTDLILDASGYFAP